MPVFKLVNSRSNEIIGTEYLTLHGWKNDVFDLGERNGTFNEQELGDDFLGVVHRYQFIGTHDANGEELFEHDIVKDQNENIFKIVWNAHELRWMMHLNNLYYTVKSDIVCVR